MDDKRNDLSDPDRPLKKNYPQQLQTRDVSTDDVKNTNGTNKEGDLLLANKPRTVSRRTERMPCGDQGNRRTTIH